MPSPNNIRQFQMQFCARPEKSAAGRFDSGAASLAKPTGSHIRELRKALMEERYSISHWGMLEIARPMLIVPPGFTIDAADRAELSRHDGIIRLVPQGR